MIYVYESEGKNKAEAEKRASEALGLPSEKLNLKASSGVGGILSLVSRKPVVLQVIDNNNELPTISVIRAVFLSLVEKMGMDAEIVDIEETDENFMVDIESEDSGILIGRQGRTLDALQFVVNVLVSSHTREKKRIVLDIAGYRKRRQQKLERLARSVADRAVKQKQSVLLESMSPYERRIVHLTLENDERVSTQSDGNGVYKRLRVIPAGESGKGKPIRNENKPAHEDYQDDF